jgi:negative regulator of flagellin synthesis FlgM
MKIDKPVQPLSPGRNSSPAKAADGAAAKPSAGQSTPVSLAVPLSNIVQIGEAIVAQVNESSSSFNVERVAEIKKAISEGRFRVDAEKIADGLLVSVREMLKRNNQPV